MLYVDSNILEASGEFIKRARLVRPCYVISQHVVSMSGKQ